MSEERDTISNQTRAELREEAANDPHIKAMSNEAKAPSAIAQLMADTMRVPVEEHYETSVNMARPIEGQLRPLSQGVNISCGNKTCGASDCISCHPNGCEEEPETSKGIGSTAHLFGLQLEEANEWEKLTDILYGVVVAADESDLTFSDPLTRSLSVLVEFCKGLWLQEEDCEEEG